MTADGMLPQEELVNRSGKANVSGTQKSIASRDSVAEGPATLCAMIAALQPFRGVKQLFRLEKPERGDQS